MPLLQDQGTILQLLCWHGVQVDKNVRENAHDDVRCASWSGFGCSEASLFGKATGKRSKNPVPGDVLFVTYCYITS